MLDDKKKRRKNSTPNPGDAAVAGWRGCNHDNVRD